MTALETRLLTEAAGRQDGADLEVVLDALAAFVRRVLGTHSAEYARPGRVATHLADEVIQAVGRADRVAIMGDPARYAEIEWLGRGDAGGTLLADSTPYSAPQRFRVFVYYGRGRERPAEAAASFRALCESRNPARPGLLWAAHATGLLITAPQAGASAGAELSMSTPTDVLTALVLPAGSRPEDARHELAFTLTIR